MKKIYKIVTIKYKIDDFGNTSLYKIEWIDNSYCITKLDHGRFQTSLYNECINNHDTIEEAIQYIEDHLEENK